jgi:hypothetical protein
LIIVVRLLLFLHLQLVRRPLRTEWEPGQGPGRFSQAVGTYFDLLPTRRANYRRDEALALG